MRQIEIVRGKVTSNEVINAQRLLEFSITHMFRMGIDEPHSWGINLPLHEDTIKIDNEVALLLETDISARLDALDVGAPHEVLDFAIRQLKASKPNDRSERDRRYQIILTELEKQLAYALVYLK